MNRALRRLVHGEEEAQREKRQRLQQILKQRIAESAASAVVAAGVASATTTSAATTVIANTPVKGNEEGEEDEEDDEDEEEEEEQVIEQQKLLASANAHWRCMEDSQQAVCLAMNRRQTLFAIGEKDGRISIWDNTTIRVITKELDPTSIVLPSVEDSGGQHEKDEKEDDGDGGGGDGDETSEPRSKRLKRTEDENLELERVEIERQPSVDDQDDDGDGSVGGESATIEDEGSVVEDDNNDTESVAKDDEHAAVDEERDDASVDEDGLHDLDGGEDDTEDVTMDADETASVDETMSADGDHTGDDELPTLSDTRAAPPIIPRKLSESTALPSDVTVEELKIAKTALKHVLSLAWSCDSRLLFAGCEEKTTRRGRLCVWDADTAWLLATFSFDGAVNAVSAHPSNPELVIVCSHNALPVLLNVRTREQSEINIPVANATLTITLPANSRQPSLVVCCRYGVSGRFLYCATSKSTISILDSETLEVLDVKLLPILIQFVDLTVNHHETAMLFTSSKGIHEFAIQDGDRKALQETRLYATGAVRAPWALCCFSSDGGYVVGTPIVRHRHVGESGLYTWHRGTGRVQHNLGVKDGVSSVAWDLRRDAIVAVSCVGAIHVLEDAFTTDWPGTMYPAGFRLITDNELDMEALEHELGEQETQEDVVVDTTLPLDVFTAPTDQEDAFEKALPRVDHELRHISSIPIPQHVKRHSQHDFHIERHFGLGQSIFEPLKSAIKKPFTSVSSKKKKKAATSNTLVPSAGKKVSSGKSRTRSRFGSSKKRRR